ncbi:ribose 5-phosphate isomerase B [Campylobacter concisus]|jgi:ribose-5-phosphate isomerase B|uniref:Ribose 5-phosphate isomerase B n=1 Tax=Campylobacter concisus TaxID=199 RepID=A0A7S9WT19_9BACT|nr:ribose 5-phosphate isomerase B [Campylobacter concisus]MBF0902564.1 ribose 5-phosphate isomerase B [Campylobacter concisus]QPH92239.1 ribose 5-phosphate isomerase B [Campylobacter concisus]
MKIDKVFLASDHAGFELKNELKEAIKGLGYEVVDLGTNDKNSVDYPDYAHLLASKLEPNCYGVLVCGTGIGISIAANRHENVRCALCHDEFTARLAREHNDANVIAFGARVIGAGVAISAAEAFLKTEFAGGRHERRVKKIELEAGK